MALIKLTASELEGVKSQISRMSSKASDCANDVSSVRNNLDMEITAKRNIENRLDNIKREMTQHSEALSSYANILNDVVDDFIRTDANGHAIHNSALLTGALANSGYGGVIIGLPPLPHTGEMYRWDAQQKLEKVRNATKIFTESSAKKEDTGFFKKLWNKGKKAVKSAYGNVVKAGKDCVSWAKDKIDDAKEWYNENEEAIKAYGKAALKVAGGVVALAGTIATAVGTGGASIPLTVLSVVDSANDIASGVADLVHASKGEYDKVGETDLLKEAIVEGTGEIGEWLGDEEAGEQVGEWIYTGYNAVNFIADVDSALKSLGKVNTIVTGTTGYSKIWGWTSFDDVANTKIKFSLEPDYFIRKIMGVEGSSDLNIVYEAGKKIVSTIGSAGDLGKEVVENINN